MRAPGLPGLCPLLQASLVLVLALQVSMLTALAQVPDNHDDRFQLIASSEPSRTKGAPAPPEDRVASSDLAAADKQYDYPLARPVYAPFVTRPQVTSWPFVEILDHNRNPSVIVTQKPHQHYLGNPMLSAVVVQDMSQTPGPQRPLSLQHAGSASLVDDFHHLGPSKIPFTDVQVMTKPIRENPASADDTHDQNFTDKFEETSLEDDTSDEDASSELLENPPNLDVAGIVENVLKKVFRENQVLEGAEDLIPQPEVGVKTWPCPPVTCCSADKPPKCSTLVNCVDGKYRKYSN